MSEVVNGIGLQQGEPIRVKDLIDQTNDALSKMGNKNPHKMLMHKLGVGVAQLATQCAILQQRVTELEQQKEQPESRLIIP